MNSPIGNAAFTIEEAQHYPFAFSTNPSLQWVNNQLIKAKPDLHKKTFLKPLHKTAEFCSTCHKVHLPVELNHYKDFLRGQNHYDSYVLSGLGHGSRSFYFPPAGRKENCASCHMPLEPSDDFGSKDFDGSANASGTRISSPAPTPVCFDLLKHEDRYKERSPQFEKCDRPQHRLPARHRPDGSDKKLRIDLFAVRDMAKDKESDEMMPVDASLTLLRPSLPTPEAGTEIPG